LQQWARDNPSAGPSPSSFHRGKVLGHFASIKTKHADTPLWYLYGRMLLMVRHDALCPPLRHQLWCKQKRERSVRKLIRPFRA
jgi:hypothetical protein